METIKKDEVKSLGDANLAVPVSQVHVAALNNEIAERYDFVKYSHSMLLQRGKSIGASSDFQFDCAFLRGLVKALEIITGSDSGWNAKLNDFRNNR